MKIGLLTTLLGPFQVSGEDGIRGAKLALAEFDNQIAGQSIELLIEGTSGLGTSAIEAIENLTKLHDVKLIVGPASGDEAVAIRNYAQNHPDITFVSIAVAQQNSNPPPSNFHSFGPNGMQMVAGLGTFAYDKGHRKIVTIGEAYSFMFSQIAGFILEFDKAGGEIVKMIWCGLGTKDFTAYLDKIPKDADAIYSTLGGMDALNFIQQYRNWDGPLPIISGSMQGDSSILHFAKEYVDILQGVICANFISDNNPDEKWQKFVQSYRTSYGKAGFYSPSTYAYGHYINMKALLIALEAIDGQIHADGANLNAILQTLQFEIPTCHIRLDRHNFPIYDNFINDIAVSSDGTLHTNMLKRIEGVDSRLGFSDDEWTKFGVFNINNMPSGRWSKNYNPFAKPLNQDNQNKE